MKKVFVPSYSIMCLKAWKENTASKSQGCAGKLSEMGAGGQGPDPAGP